MVVLTEHHEDEDGRDQKDDAAARPRDGRDEWARRQADECGQQRDHQRAEPTVGKQRRQEGGRVIDKPPRLVHETREERGIEQEDEGIQVIEQLRTNAQEHVEVEDGEEADDVGDERKPSPPAISLDVLHFALPEITPRVLQLLHG